MGEMGQGIVSCQDLIPFLLSCCLHLSRAPLSADGGEPLRGARNRLVKAMSLDCRDMSNSH